ncbi:MAG: MBL fold metallo-hydrolase [Archangium sp.]
MSPQLVTIDTHYVMPQLAAAYLRVEGRDAAFIEVNTTYAVPYLLTALRDAGRAPEDVKFIIVTHVHLDHAGGTSALLKACPNATVIAHPRAARHLIDPSRLVASARQVYGDEAFDELYGTIEPIEASRVRTMEDGETLQLGDATLRFLHTRGHANHHFVVHDEKENVVFTGDTFGLVYPALQKARRFAIASTSPTDFDGPAAIESVKRILALKPRAVALTHFGLYEDVEAIGEQLIGWLELSSKLFDEGTASGDELGTLEQRFKWKLDTEMGDAAQRSGFVPSAEDKKLMKFDLELNAQGLAFAAVKARG